MTKPQGSTAVLSRTLSSALIIALVTAAGLSTTVAYAQADGTKPPAAAKAGEKTATSAELLEDFLHYTTIRSVEAAQGVGDELISRDIKPADFATLVESGDLSRFDQKIQVALRISALEPTAGKLLKLYERGKLERARDPGEVARNIALLTVSDRGRMLARQRFQQAGEYAVPQMLETLLSSKDEKKNFYLRNALKDMGRQAIVPLTTALSEVPQDHQEIIVSILAQIPYRTSLPFLSDLAATTKSEGVKAACERAIQTLGGSSVDVPSQYRQLAEEYYASRVDVTSFPGEEHQLLWSYKPQAGGLVMQAIKTPVFHEAMAMRLAERAMTLESGTGGVTAGTLALWVASNLSREIDTPAGYANPAYPVAETATAGEQARRSAMYFAVASGPEISQQVLARAIDTRNTPLARRALEAVEKTGGKSALVKTGLGNRSPLLEAITYPNRRVQFEAALAVAVSQPTETFAGADRVVPTLAAAVRGADERFAAIIATEVEQYQQTRRVLEAAGFKVLPQGRSIVDLASAMNEVPSVDLLVSIGLTGDKVPALIGEARTMPRTIATPVLAITNQETYIELGQRYQSDVTVAVRPVGLGQPELTTAVSNLIQSASGGPISSEEAVAYSKRSVAALRDLAISGNTVLNPADATTLLIANLNASAGGTKIAVADVLSRLGVDRAQRSLIDAAMAASGSERVDLLNAVASSAKRFGNMLEPAQTARIIELASKGSDTEATAAAGLMGALSLPNTQILPLIVKK